MKPANRDATTRNNELDGAGTARGGTLRRWVRRAVHPFSVSLGPRIEPGAINGYYIDFRSKAKAPQWPPPWFDPSKTVHVAPIQWALGCYERYLDGDGEQWLAAAANAAEYMLERQQREGPLAGGWRHAFAIKHTYRLPAGWLSAMAQGEGASLFLRLYGETSDERLVDAARLALRPMRVPTAEGGVRAELEGGFFPEEYPTDPPSYVLNGAIFALWGCYDAAVGLGDESAAELFAEGAETIAASVGYFDTGHWSLYDLYPHAMLNVASPAYHRLHTDQFTALNMIAPRAEFADTADRFERYGSSRLAAAGALARKVIFRIAVPRNPLFARRTPWSRDTV